MRVHPSSGRVQSGFTLVELMVVVMIIGIMTALMVPEMKGSFQDALLRSTGREMINVFELAASRAVSLNQVRRVRLDEDAGRYVVERQIQAGARDEFVAVDDVPNPRGKIDERVTMEYRRAGQMADPTEGASSGAGELSAGAGAVIAFYPDGTADAGALELRDRQGYHLQLRINPVTARVHIVDSEPEGEP